MDYNMNQQELINRKLIHGGDIYSASEIFSKMENPPELIDFSANINPLGLPEGVKKALTKAAGSFDVYPDPLCRDLVRQLAEQESVPAEWILCGNGAADLIFRMVFAVKPKKAMVLAPTFAEYEEALKAISCRVIHHRLDSEGGFRAGEELLDELDGDLDMLFLCNPNNPTGQLMKKEFLHKVALRCRELGILLMIDECFNDFLDEQEEYSVKEYLKDYNNLVVLKAFTKIFAMAGIRLGHCITSNKALITKLRAAGQPWSVSSPAQTAGLQAIKEKEYLLETKKLIRTEREYLIPELQRNGIEVIASGANYIFIRYQQNQGFSLHEQLFNKGILIRNCDNYHGLEPGYYRICIRKHEDNVKLIEALQDITGRNQRI